MDFFQENGDDDDFIDDTVYLNVKSSKQIQKPQFRICTIQNSEYAQFRICDFHVQFQPCLLNYYKSVFL